MENMNSRRGKLLNEKKRLFDELLEITKKQTLWIKKRNWTRLHNAINSKQDRIDKIDDLDELIKKTASFRHSNEEEQEEEMVRDIEYIAQKIVEIEQSNIEEIRETMKTLKNELKEVQLKKRVSNTYKDQKNNNNGSYVDKYK